MRDIRSPMAKANVPSTNQNQTCLARKFARNAASRKRSKTLVLFVVTIFHGRFRVNTVIFKQCVGPLKTSEGIKFTKKLQRFLVVITKVPANQAISGENTIGFGSDGRGGEKKKKEKRRERKKERKEGRREGRKREGKGRGKNGKENGRHERLDERRRGRQGQ